MVTTSKYTRPWADGPWPLIETPSKTQNVSEHPAVYIANEMAFAHNSMLRGLNSIYLQAPHISDPQDISDFLFFVHAWAGWVSHHHVLEEEKMFPGFESVIGIPSFLESNVEQHHSFQPLLKQLLEYSTETQPADYQATVVRQLIEKMAPSFRQHLSDEITSLLSMEPYDGDALLKVYRECEADAGKQDKHVVPPMVLGLRDVTFEGGNQWPAMPPLSAWFVYYLFSGKHAGSWRFLPCDTWGTPRALEFVMEDS
ncbi:uncharacterized protein BO97DRAFT_345986 [Aspergillus homomorphus CBS 101889]|uniref:Hemerythrin-like domain-containing protein n=1 Tax=Aspergillus homomorphus (strain CBS 101889) TaxID=1450537 RepID=A0A395HXA5_ASPHC|nr:hypothetical protein BO97DRAFT_345986 [Aspergillus homomorphus CBS 101889]RAL12065.1 hypothetical protein BO97DRAFT_345986 [Aspergillus homomorphus CBS 101889]